MCDGGEDNNATMRSGRVEEALGGGGGGGDMEGLGAKCPNRTDQ